MRALILCASLLFLTVQADAQSAPEAAAGPMLPGVDINREPRTHLAVFGFNQCMDSFQGLPPAGEGGRILILWPCTGRDNQRITLLDGALYVGEARLHRVEILTPGPNRCDERHVASARRAYAMGICRRPDMVAQRRVDFEDGRTFIGSQAPPEMVGPMAGDPLVVRYVRPGEEADAVRWEYVPETHQLRVVGTELCITPPSQDMSGGAPLYLDNCALPFRLVRDDEEDGARRTRVEFGQIWRVQY